MAKTKIQLAKEKRDAAAASKAIASPNPFDYDGLAFDGKDKDNPRSESDDDAEPNKPGQLEVDFKRILKTAFRIKGDTKHEVFEALEFAGIYT